MYSHTRTKHQILTSSNAETLDVELEDQQSLQVFQMGVRVCDSGDATCIREYVWNLKPKEPQLSPHQTWIRVCPKQKIISERLHAENNWLLEKNRCYVDLHRRDTLDHSASSVHKMLNGFRTTQ